ncbi:Chromosomal replication initiator protein dnaA [Sinorhizobium fredii HH103]|uniref:Chromosomal replication initiator protein dnaA n=1 Tax=Sinorhizobium fredii (strain HH103) TaxID=1117943 RepID=G9A7W1_SINF1|nr:Chromosomal replication initiator protein dnaA [Sinorhizobium fredii HH103]
MAKSLFEPISQYLADTPHLQSLRRHPVPSSSQSKEETSHQQNTHARRRPKGAASSWNQGATISRNWGARSFRNQGADCLGICTAIAELEAQLAELATENAAKARRIATLEADLADAQARLLAQAQVLLSGRRADDDDEADGDRSSIEEIVAAVLADFPGVTWADIVSVRRDRRLVKPRHACMRAVYEKRRDLSLPRIGRIFHRDHTTVLAAVNRPVP